MLPSVIKLKKNYIPINLLGSGGFGDVFEVTTDNDKNRKYALKVITTNPREEEGIPCLMEASIMASYDHPYLNNALSIETSGGSLYILQDVAQGTLFDWIGSRNVDDFWIGDIINNIAQALSFLHNNGITHGDVKSTNVLVFKENDSIIFKLSDFNLTTFHDWHSNIPVCTDSHRPLEAWLGDDWDEKIDIWGLGCIVYNAKYGDALFERQDKESPSGERRKMYINALYDWKNYWIENVPPPRNNIKKKTNDYYRVSFNKPNIIESAFANDPLKVLIISMLCPTANGRPTTEDILDHKIIKSRYNKRKIGNFNRLTPLNIVDNVPRQLVDRPKKSVVMLNSAPNYRDLFYEVYTKNSGIADLAARIYERYQNIKNISLSSSLHAIKSACIWIAGKIMRVDISCNKPPSINPKIDIEILRKTERDICVALDFILH